MTTLVLLPGMDGTGDLFEPFVQYLPKAWKVVVVRYPADRPLSFDELVAEVQKILPSVGDYVLLGESFSGPIATRLASQADQRLIGLILCCTFVTCPSNLLKYLGAVLNNYPVSKVPFFIIKTALLGKHSSIYLSKLLKFTIRRVSDAVYKTRLNTVQHIDERASAKAITIPVMYLRATNDKLVKSTFAEELHQHIPDMVIEHINGPHCLLQASSQMAANKVTAFIKRLQSH